MRGSGRWRGGDGGGVGPPFYHLTACTVITLHAAIPGAYYEHDGYSVQVLHFALFKRLCSLTKG